MRYFVSNVNASFHHVRIYCVDALEISATVGCTAGMHCSDTYFPSEVILEARQTYRYEGVRHNVPGLVQKKLISSHVDERCIYFRKNVKYSKKSSFAYCFAHDGKH